MQTGGRELMEGGSFILGLVVVELPWGDAAVHHVDGT